MQIQSILTFSWLMCLRIIAKTINLSHFPQYVCINWYTYLRLVEASQRQHAAGIIASIRCKLHITSVLSKGSMLFLVLLQQYNKEQLAYAITTTRRNNNNNGETTIDVTTDILHSLFVLLELDFEGGWYLLRLWILRSKAIFFLIPDTNSRYT